MNHFKFLEKMNFPAKLLHPNTGQLISDITQRYYWAEMVHKFMIFDLRDEANVYLVDFSDIQGTLPNMSSSLT